jgi:two-component system response regulator AlgR
MKRLRTLIVDDEPLAIERLQILSADHPIIEIVGKANDGVEALRIAQALTPDLIFLDIGMPKMDGINAARALGLMPKKPAIILITAYDNFAVEAFDLDVVDYVLKPVSSERLGRAITRAIGAPEAETHVPELSAKTNGRYAHEFWVSHRTELIRIAAVDIERIEAERDYMRLYTNAGAICYTRRFLRWNKGWTPNDFSAFTAAILCAAISSPDCGMKVAGSGMPCWARITPCA